MGAAIVGACDRPKALLPGRVPDLQLHAQPVDVHGADLEVNADGGYVTARECVVRESDEQRRLANACRGLDRMKTVGTVLSYSVTLGSRVTSAAAD